jgi:trimethylamine-N-oxide reductase (cytochrome c)
MMVLLQAMQGLGKPGIGIWGTAMGAPRNNDVFFPGYGDPDGRIAHTRAAKHIPQNPVQQKLYRLLLPDAVLAPPVSWTGETFSNRSLEQQFKPFTYPMPGNSE